MTVNTSGPASAARTVLSKSDQPSASVQLGKHNISLKEHGSLNKAFQNFMRGGEAAAGIAITLVGFAIDSTSAVKAGKEMFLDAVAGHTFSAKNTGTPPDCVQQKSTQESDQNQEPSASGGEVEGDGGGDGDTIDKEIHHSDASPTTDDEVHGAGES